MDTFTDLLDDIWGIPGGMLESFGNTVGGFLDDVF